MTHRKSRLSKHRVRLIEYSDTESDGNAYTAGRGQRFRHDDGDDKQLMCGCLY